MPGHRHRLRHRTDSTKKALVLEAKRLGARVLDIEGIIDSVLLLSNGRVLLVDWKRPDADLTPTQRLLVDKGWPIVFLATVEELREVVSA